MNARNAALAGCAGGLCAISVALAGPDCGEPGDAGSFPSTAAACFGAGSLKSIKGELEGTSLAGVPDTEDMYLIYISDPSDFCARTVNVPEDCCKNEYPIDPEYATEFNTQLWLFRFDELGLLGNDDNPADPPRSLLLSQATLPDPTVIPGPGLYYLAITGGPENVPLDFNGQALFSLGSTTEISGPDGPGGGNALAQWSGGGRVGKYTIVLCGVSLVPERGIPTSSEWTLIITAGLLLVGGAILIARRTSAPIAA